MKSISQKQKGTWVKDCVTADSKIVLWFILKYRSFFCVGVLGLVGLLGSVSGLVEMVLWIRSDHRVVMVEV